MKTKAKIALLLIALSISGQALAISLPPWLARYFPSYVLTNDGL